MPVERNSGPRNLVSKVMRGGLQKLPYHTSETTAGSETGPAGELRVAGYDRDAAQTNYHRTE